MKPPSALWLFVAALSLSACAPAPGAAVPDTPAVHEPPRALSAFASETQFRATLNDLRAQYLRDRSARKEAVDLPSMPMAAADAAAAPMAEARAGAANASDSITNVQTQGVDEGDIVKQQGDYLIVLRRGRLFTVRIGGDQLQPVSSIDAFAPQSNPDQTWYDEMLVSDGTVVVIGYSYERGGTEIGLFDLDARGRLRYRDTYQLRSNDYYSASNYASRLIGRTLVFYAPMALNLHDDDAGRTLPALRRWHPGATPDEFQRILPATRIYRGPGAIDLADTTVHTVSLCDLDAPRMACRSSAVLGPSGRTFYVSQDAVYIWTSYYQPTSGQPNSTVFRMPLDGSAPSALRASGAPVDQMSFLQRGGWLNVLLASQGQGEAMWASRNQPGELTLLRVPLKAFGDGSEIADPGAYRPLPGVQAPLHARFIGDWLLFGGGAFGQDAASMPQAHALRYAAREPLQSLPLRHGLERIDALGRDAIAIGADLGGAGLRFTSLRLGAHASIAGDYLQPRAMQGDQRTHGFFYHPDNADSGVLGLPVIGADDRGNDSAGVLYLSNTDLALSRMGELGSRARADIDDGCRVSCVDWYGNARPIFIGERIFALLGYELVEGRRDGARIVERRRSNFSPRLATSP